MSKIPKGMLPTPYEKWKARYLNVSDYWPYFGIGFFATATLLYASKQRDKNSDIEKISKIKPPKPVDIRTELYSAHSSDKRLSPSQSKIEHAAIDFGKNPNIEVGEEMPRNKLPGSSFPPSSLANPPHFKPPPIHNEELSATKRH